VILVAGGTGLLGSRVVGQLVERGERVRVLTRDPRRAAHLPAGVQTMVGDVRGGPLDSVVEGCSSVVSAVHGFTGPTRTNPAAVDRDGNHHLIAAATRAGVDRFVLVSGVDARPDHPMSLHRMKHAAEQDLQGAVLPGVIVRATCFLETWLDVIGTKIAVGGAALVLGPGRNPINFVSADDVAAFVRLAVSGDERIGAEVSVGGPQNLTFIEIAQRLLAGTGRTDRIRHVPLSALRALSVLARPISPDFARRAGAAVVMNTTDMTFDAAPVRDLFPEIDPTTIAQLTDPLSCGRAR